jgi:hypothetical protein
MHFVTLAQDGPKNERLVAINKDNVEFYSKRGKLAESLLNAPRIATATLHQYQEDFRQTQLLLLNLSPIERLKASAPYEQTLFAVSRIQAHLNAPEARGSRPQSGRAKRRRNRVGDHETPIYLLIKELALKDEFRVLPYRQLAPHFFSRLRDDHCSPRWIKSEKGKSRQDRIEYDFYRLLKSQDPPPTEEFDETIETVSRLEKIRKTITIGRFENIVSEIRRASRKTG